ncbi:MAG: hypothetical protein ACOYOK_08685, partial [Pseudobdellovibrionaceae bacterium]
VCLFKKIIFLFFTLFGVQTVFAYPDFIGYGYTSCMTCHFNGAGGGALNDYGRGLFAAEIAAKPPWQRRTSDEKLAFQSGFLGSKTLPWWVRPGIKYRGLYFRTDPGSRSSISRFVQMQLDVNSAIFFDKDQKWTLYGSGGYVPKPQGSNGSKEQERNFISREYYIKWQKNENFWVYLGFLDKVYGIRTPDHTAFSRKQVGVAQNDQAHSILFQYSNEKNDFFIQPFLGNLNQEKDLRQVGASLMYEYQPIEKLRVGGSFLSSKNDYARLDRGALHLRFGIDKGHSVLTETGLIQDTPASSGKSSLGAYGLFQSTLRLQRGLNFISIGQYYKKKLDSVTDDQTKWGLGILYFPMQRFELRVEALNTKTIAADEVPDPGWSLQTQLHLSL